MSSRRPEQLVRPPGHDICGGLRPGYGHTQQPACLGYPGGNLMPMEMPSPHHHDRLRGADSGDPISGDNVARVSNIESVKAEWDTLLPSSGSSRV